MPRRTNTMYARWNPIGTVSYSESDTDGRDIEPGTLEKFRELVQVLTTEKYTPIFVETSRRNTG